MRRALLVCLLAALAALIVPGQARAEAFAIDASEPVEVRKGGEQAKALRPQSLCIRNTPQLRKAGPPDSDKADPAAAVIPDPLDLEIERGVALAREMLRPGSILRVLPERARPPPIVA
ncbi:MAG TPA: hypothetical protein VNK52_09325 [Hyphomicrobiaceae bacterium]|nr:hypothetical protein [Hyphomicrobiaceae bacterium]